MQKLRSSPPKLLTQTDVALVVRPVLCTWLGLSWVFPDPGRAALHFQTADLLKVPDVALCKDHGATSTDSGSCPVTGRMDRHQELVQTCLVTKGGLC